MPSNAKPAPTSRATVSTAVRNPTGYAGADPIRRPDAEPPKLKYAPSHSFVFIAHANAWDVFPRAKGDDDAPAYEVLPALQALQAQPGVDGCTAVKGFDDGDLGRALMNMRRQGWHDVPEDLEVVAFGETYRGYVHRFEGETGPIHFDRWTRPYALAGGDVRFDRDVAGYRAFQRQVAAMFFPDGPPPAVLADLQRKLEVLADQSAGSRDRSASAKRLNDEVTKRIEALAADAPKSVSVPGSEPKRRPGAGA